MKKMKMKTKRIMRTRLISKLRSQGARGERLEEIVHI